MVKLTFGTEDSITQARTAKDLKDRYVKLWRKLNPKGRKGWLDEQDTNELAVLRKYLDKDWGFSFRVNGEIFNPNEDGPAKKVVRL